MLDEKNRDVLKQFMANNLQNSNASDRMESDKAQQQKLPQLPELGKTVELGNWPYTTDGESHPVEWIALRVSEKDQVALLITKYCIGCQPCDIMNEELLGGMIWGAEQKAPYSFCWPKSSLFFWLKNEFYEKCFSDEEKKRILKQTIYEGQERYFTPVNLLSAVQVLSLLPRPYERQAELGPYRPENDKEGFIPWWLLDTTDFESDAAAVFADGSVCVRSSDEAQWTDLAFEKSGKAKRPPICHGLGVMAHVGIRPVIRHSFSDIEGHHGN